MAYDRSLGGFLFNEHSYIYPFDRLGRQVYSPKLQVILPLYVCHSAQVILERPAVLLTSQSHADPELVKVKTKIGCVRSGL